MSAGLPSGAPVSTHREMVSICSSLSELSLAKCLMPTVLSMSHGGICRLTTRALIARAHGRVSSYVTSDIGAIESARWQAWHLSWRIGATSLAKVTGSPAAHASDEQAVKRVTTRASRTADGRRADIVRSRFRMIADAGRIIRLRIGDRGSGFGVRDSGRIHAK